MCNEKLKEDVCRTFAKHRLEFLSGYKDVQLVKFESIPKVRTLFPGSKIDYWRLEESSEGGLCVIFTLGPKSIFTTHLHMLSDETCTLLTPGAKVEWVTERKISFYEYPEKFSAFKGEKHALVNLVDFPIDIKIEWSEEMEKWSAIFLNKENKTLQNGTDIK